MAVPNTLPVSIGGREYLVDVQGIERASLPVTRQQTDTREVLGEHSISPLDLWRRSQASWHLGAGQEYLDLEDSSPFRFRSSVGINPWEKGRLTLLPLAQQIYAMTGSSIKIVTARDLNGVEFLYVADGTALKYTTSDPNGTVTFTTVTGTPGSAFSDIVSDGFNIYITYAGTIYKTTAGAASVSSYVTGGGAELGYVKGRLILADTASLYNITAAGARPSALFTHSNTNFRWKGFAEGLNVLYAAGYGGTKSQIFRIGLKPDGTSLANPIVAAELPDGEFVSAIYGYMGLVLIGSNRGVRLAEPDGAGNLLVGPAFMYQSPGDDVTVVSGDRHAYFFSNPTDSVTAFEGEGRFVWFSWSPMPETASTGGLGRIDLSRFTGPLTPAYAPDMTGNAGVSADPIRSIVTYYNVRCWSVRNGTGTTEGIWAESSTKYRADGSLYSGLITYDLADSKSFEQIEVIHRSESLTGADIGIGLKVDGASSLTATTSKQPTTTIPYMTFTPTGTKKGRDAEVQAYLEASTDTLGTPVVSRYTLRSMPIARRGEHIRLPLLLKEKIVQRNGVTKTYDPKTEFDALKTFETTGTSVTVQIGDESFSGFLDEVRWGPDLSFTEKGNKLQGTCTVTIRRFY